MGVTDKTVLDQFSGRLLEGEKILWYGRPAQGLMLTPRDGFLIPFSLIWGGFAIFWTISAARTGAPFFSTLWGLPFVLVGLFMMFGRFWVDAWLRGRIAYALTDRRVLISRSRPWADFNAIRLDGLPETSFSEDSRGRGTIRFGSRPSAWGGSRTNSGGWIPSLDPTPQFIKIDDARRVFAVIQERSQGGGG